MPDFLPRRAAEMVDWTRSFSQTIREDPTAFGLSAQEADDYAELQEAYALAYRRSQDPSTRSPAQVQAKDTALKALKERTRQLAWRVRAAIGKQNPALNRLGLKPRSYNRRALPAPVSSPRLRLTPTIGSDVVLQLEDRDRLGKAKPRGVAGAIVMVYVGDTPPRDVMDWTFAFGTTRTRLSVPLPKGLSPGTRVWYAAWWQSPTGEPGPTSEPVSTRVGFYETLRFTRKQAA